MAQERLANSPVGHLVRIEGGHRAFVPEPMPRLIDLPAPLVCQLDEASRAVAMLAGVGETIPNPNLLIRPFLRREAVLSSSIEGTQASLSDLFLYEASDKRQPKGDVREVYNYVRAFSQGLDLLKSLPICVRLVNQVHQTLLAGVRGDEKRPGEPRTRQVWIGHEQTRIEDARYVPPPAPLVRDLLEDWERCINEVPAPMPPLVQCALMHYQFEAIHPYTDGNGRMGRLLIALFLCARNVLPTPLLYLSAYFERTRQQYYDELLRVSESGAFGRWVDYFLKGVAEQAKDALVRARRVRQLQDAKRMLLMKQRESGSAMRLMDELFSNPYCTAPNAARVLGVSNPGARGILDRLAELGVLEGMPGTWPRMYVFRELLQVIDAPVHRGSAP